MCNANAEVHLLDEGVSWELAQFRKQMYKDLMYNIFLSIPEDKSQDIEGEEVVSLCLDAPRDIILDFRESIDKLHKIYVDKSKGQNSKSNFKECKNWLFTNDHIVIPKKYTHKGYNRVKIEFTAGNQSINRRDGYVYTLFVPDRARTAFPCFDQPNMKAKFALDLEIPKGWKDVTNGLREIMVSEKKLKKGERGYYTAKPGYKRRHSFIATPIPTYLFAFAVGEFEYKKYSEDGYSVGAYYRETDSARIAQLPEIMHQVIFSMKWQEEFTGVKYPFPKYDLVILPGFQFGGMEHVGATFYNDNTIFLPANPTPDEKLRRTELIAHETSHMWFGDAVTMNWFDDVWTKEVFANYFAAEITTPLFPELNHDLNWLKTYTAAAIRQDRTEGRTSIRQPLSNMRYAGLIYNNIIYNKAPVMMRKMVELMGKEAFQRGIKRYVKEYMYDNATWDQLIDILDAETDVDLKTFSKVWVDSKYWPHYIATSINDSRIGKEYGYMEFTGEQIDSLLSVGIEEKDETRRQALLMTLNENYLNGKIGDVEWMEKLLKDLQNETDPLTSLTLVSYMYEPLQLSFDKGKTFDVDVFEMSKTHPLQAIRTQLLRLLISEARTPEVVDSLYNIWKSNDSPLLSINDFMSLSYQLSVRMPEKAHDILREQRSRISNADRLAQFDFVSRAVNPSEAARDSLFESLKIAENRRIEPWTSSVLYYLNHPLRDKQSVKYIRPALELLPEIQRTGDIFFPGDWCSNLLSGHRSEEAYQEVDRFLADNPDMLDLLRNKILQAEYYLKRMHK